MEEHFYGQIPSVRARTYGAIHASLSLLGDSHTVFVEPAPRQLERDRLRGVFGGIGVTLRRDPDGQVVMSPHRDSPAERVGVSEGDILLAVDGAEVGGDLELHDVQALFRGNVGSAVTLTVSRPPTLPFDITVVRDEVRVPSVSWRVLDPRREIGYLRVDSFTERTRSEVVAGLAELQRAGATSLILDLRDNRGGLIASAIQVASQFLGEGVVFYEQRGDAHERQAIPVESGGSALDLPMAVLVNGGTASSAEIVAGALQDQHRAPLIGEPTLGKGSVQLIHDFPDGSSLHVTSGLWLTPSGHQIEGQGLTPDISLDRGRTLQDRQLDRAAAYLAARRAEK
jgi:carboxyl-terminal processing protease